MATQFACALLAAALLLCSAAPSMADDSPFFARRLKQLGFLQGIANLPGTTAPVGPATQPNPNAAISPTQPGCTDYSIVLNACTACGQGYQYNVNDPVAVCGCAPNYSRASATSPCVFSGPGPAPAPLPSPTSSPLPGLPGNYGGPIPDPATNPTGFIAFQAAVNIQVNNILQSLGLTAAGKK